MTSLKILAEGLRFPEGPIAMADGSVLVVEIARGTLTRIAPDGSLEILAELGGGPNGAAIGPDGLVYICNNGGFEWSDSEGMLLPAGTPASYGGGSIQRVNIATGAVETLYTHCNGETLKGPNDLVFDEKGGFWFTDSGKRYSRTEDIGAVYYARCDGEFIAERLYPSMRPNGIALSPDGRVLYVAETMVGRVWHYPIPIPGELEIPEGRFNLSALLYGAPGYNLFDSMAMEAKGNLCIGTPALGAITVISPKGELVECVAMPDPVTTNIAFGGPALQTAYITLSSSGRLAAMEWPRPGLALNY